MFTKFAEISQTNLFSSPFNKASCDAPNSIMPAIKEGDSCEFGSSKYYALCGFGGILSCGITHTAVVPLDLVKCRIQVDPAKYTGIFQGGRLTIAEEGVRGLAKGWAPTLIGYSMQGLCKFGFYEVFKILYGNI
uniref:Uncharacterized protein n=1 Tax=Clytia hemisphaerica TaxID=252671 RepID=A0A7M5X7B1_9CNID